MKLTNIIYQEREDLSARMRYQGISDGPSTLVQIFTGLTDEEGIRALLLEIRLSLPHAVICGATTAGEIVNGRALSDSTVISIAEFRNTRIECVSVNDGDAHQLGKRLAARIGSTHPALLITYANAIDLNGDDYRSGIQSVFPGVPLAGGLAGDNRAFVKTMVMHGQEVMTEGAVLVALENDALQVRTCISLDWLPLGKELEITRADGNHVYTIDNVEAVEVYRRYLGDDVMDRISRVGMLFPLLVERQGHRVARACTAVEADGSLRFMGSLRQGECARFGMGDPNAVVKSLQRAHDTLLDTGIEAIFVYSSVSRKRLLRSSADMEAHFLQAIAPTAGFFTYGEFHSLPEGSEFFNFAMTCVALSENVGAHAQASPEVGQLSPTDTHVELRGFSHLVQATSRELEHINASLERLATTDPLTDTYNRRKMNDLIATEITRRRRYGRRATVMMFDLDDFKLVNDEFGHDVGDLVIKSVAETVREIVRSMDSIARWGGEEFLILSTETSMEEAAQLAERIRQCIERRHHRADLKITASFGVTEIRPDDDPNQLLRRVDQALYEAKHSGRNCLRVA